MELLTLAEAWWWVQIGGCLAFGAGMVVLIFRALVYIPLLHLAPSPEFIPEVPPPHCSKCCPHEEDLAADLPP